MFFFSDMNSLHKHFSFISHIWLILSAFWILFCAGLDFNATLLILEQRASCTSLTFCQGSDFLLPVFVLIPREGKAQKMIKVLNETLNLSEVEHWANSRSSLRGGLLLQSLTEHGRVPTSWRKPLKVTWFHTETSWTSTRSTDSFTFLTGLNLSVPSRSPSEYWQFK